MRNTTSTYSNIYKKIEGYIHNKYYNLTKNEISNKSCFMRNILDCMINKSCQMNVVECMMKLYEMCFLLNYTNARKNPSMEQKLLF